MSTPPKLQLGYGTLYLLHNDQIIPRVHSVHLMNVEQRQAATGPQIKPHDLGYESACFRQLASTTTIASLLLLLSPKADTHLPTLIG